MKLKYSECCYDYDNPGLESACGGLDNEGWHGDAAWVRELHAEVVRLRSVKLAGDELEKATGELIAKLQERGIS